MFKKICNNFCKVTSQGHPERLTIVRVDIFETKFNFKVKIIVPNTTAGLIIGKAGATIKQIMENSGAKVQLSQKPEQINLQVSFSVIIEKKEK